MNTVLFFENMQIILSINDTKWDNISSYFVKSAIIMESSTASVIVVFARLIKYQ